MTLCLSANAPVSKLQMIFKIQNCVSGLCRQARSSRYHHLRNFFASSTDHTQLLQGAEIHCIIQENAIKQYVLVAEGINEEMVRKVPQLHLARIFVDQHKIFGAKVVNRTLGKCPDICSRLLDAALSDACDNIQAWSTLHDLSPWVVSKKDGDIAGLGAAELKNVISISKNHADSSLDKNAWDTVAVEYIKQGLSDESNLYMTRGTLSHIEHNADKSEFANTCSGSMAVFNLT